MKILWFLFKFNLFYRQGTNIPTNFIVLYDNTELTSNNIYKLTYYLTIQCYYTTKSIKVPAPFIILLKEIILQENL